VGWVGENKNMKKYRIEFVIRVPEEVPEEQVEAWARFTIGDTGSLPKNPLEDESFDPIYGTFKIEALP
jgi:hypothetical protein